jgi:thioredoxin-like negative regulator of GroEL
VRTIPAFAVFKDGKLVGLREGEPLSKVEALIAKAKLRRVSRRAKVTISTGDKVAFDAMAVMHAEAVMRFARTCDERTSELKERHAAALSHLAFVCVYL